MLVRSLTLHRAVAWVARTLGQRARIFVPDGAHPDAMFAIVAKGAEVTRVPGSCDAAAHRAA